MSRASRNHAHAHRAALVGASLSVGLHVAVFALVSVRVPVGSTNEDVIRLATSLPAPQSRTERRTPEERPEELQLVRTEAPIGVQASGDASPTASTLGSRTANAASAAPVAAAGGELAASYEPLRLIHPSQRTVSARVAYTDTTAFSATVVAASSTADGAPPLYDGGAVASAKQRWADAAGVGARGAGLRVGLGGGGACGIPGRRGPVTSWF
ncbi:MAG: hypothetical protein WEA24_17820 [Gemmatimonadota bacterium]